MWQESPSVHSFQKILSLKCFICSEIVVGYLCLFCKPTALVIFRAVFPTIGKISGAELLFPNGNCIQELIIQFRVRIRLHLNDIGNVKCVAIASKSIPVIRPTHAVILQPPKALKHALGKDDVHISNGMLLSPDISYGLLTTKAQDPVKIHLMHHSLHIGQTDLEGCMDGCTAECPVYNLGVPLGN